MLALVEQAEARVRSSPVDFIAWLPMQIAWLKHDDDRPALFRAGNRQGKTTVGGAELIFRCRGVHPFKVVKASPARCAIVCFTKTQSVAIQEVIWNLLGGTSNTELVEGCTFNKKTGFGGHRAVILFKNGSSIVVFANAQGPQSIAGSKFDYILLDEPPAQVVFDECLARTTDTGGRLGLTLTPINGPPLPWLVELTAPEDGSPAIVVDYHTTLTPESQISPMTGKVRLNEVGIPWDAAFIASLWKKTNPIDAPIRLNGEWESRTEGQFFKCFDVNKHVTSHFPATAMEKLYMGIDYAQADRLGMCAVLSGVELVEVDGVKRPQVWTIDEVIVPGTSTMSQFARAIFNMLQRHGIKWSELDGVYGDNGIKSRWQISSNIELTKHLAPLFGLRPDAMRPKVMSVKKDGGSSGRYESAKDDRCKWLFQELASDRFMIHPRCKTLIKALGEWDYTDKHELKDVLDATMYGLKDFWVRRRFATHVPKVVIG
jgi:phage terminase large subunit-like protein